MANGTSVKLLWQIMERLQGSTCEYQNSEIVPDERVVYLPKVRATFLREWPGSPNIHTRKATYQRVFISVANAGGFSRVRMVPLKSFRLGTGDTPVVMPAHGRHYLLPDEELPPFVSLNASPVMEAVHPPVGWQREPDNYPPSRHSRLQTQPVVDAEVRRDGE